MARTTFQDRDRELLTGKNFAHVATRGESGDVQVVPLWVDLEDSHVVLNGARSRDWLRNLRRDPSVTLTVQNLEDPYEYVEVRGRADIGEPRSGDAHIDKMAQKYFGMQTYPDHRPDDPRVLVRVQPSSVRRHGTR